MKCSFGAYARGRLPPLLPLITRLEPTLAQTANEVPPDQVFVLPRLSGLSEQHLQHARLTLEGLSRCAMYPLDMPADASGDETLAIIEEVMPPPPPPPPPPPSLLFFSCRVCRKGGKQKMMGMPSSCRVFARPTDRGDSGCKAARGIHPLQEHREDHAVGHNVLCGIEA